MRVLDLQIVLGADDGFSSTTPIGGTPVCLLSNFNEIRIGISTVIGSEQDGIMRFLNVTIPPGATITEAHLTIHTISGLILLIPERRVAAEVAADAAAFVNFTNCLAGRVFTTASVQWDDDIPIFTDGDSPNLSAVIQEVIDGPGWASGNAMVIVVFNDAAPTPFQFQDHRDFEDVPAEAPRLHIEFTPPPGVDQDIVKHSGSLTTIKKDASLTASLLSGRIDLTLLEEED